MPIVLVVARERTEWWRENAPTAAEIDAAFRATSVGASWGSWVGSGPRIVRHIYDASNAPAGSYGLYTYAAQPFEIPEAQSGHATYILRRLLEALDAQLDRSRPRGTFGATLAWEPSTVSVYDEARNGAPSWWRSGEAQRTQTRDAQERAFLSFVMSNRENPVGPRATAPTSSGTGSGPATLPDRGGDLADEAARALKKYAPWLILGGLALLALYVAPSFARGAAYSAGTRVQANPSRRRRRVLSNPRGRPRIWEIAQPGTAYECATPLRGRIVPGKGGGYVRSCATPSRRQPRKGQVYLIPDVGKELAPGTGWAMPKDRAARRLRDAPKPKAKALDLAYLAEAHEGYRATGLPAPSGLEWPHVAGSSVCDPEHKVWRGWDSALEEARERAAIESEGGSDRDYDEATRRALKRAPQWPQWDEAARQCARAFDSRQERKKPKATSAATERGAILREYRELGEGAFVERYGGELSEVLDQLTEGYKKKPRAAITRVRKARK